jgi:hypothetical protein
MEGMLKMKPEEITPELIDFIFDNVDESKLDKWTFDFVISTKAYWKKNKRLSDKQKKRLGELWEKQLSDKSSGGGGSAKPQ